MRAIVLFAAVAVLGSAGALAQTGDPSGLLSAVRPPDSSRIRTAITGLIGWRVAIPATSFRQLTFSEAAAKADALGLAYVEGFSTQKVSPQSREI
jgi:hypothetical protein